MKTILVVYIGNKITPEKAQSLGLKKYCFKTDDDLKVGDIIKSNNYTTNMLVTDVINKEYYFVNYATGDLSIEATSTKCWSIRTLCLRDENESTVYAYRID